MEQLIPIVNQLQDVFNTVGGGSNLVNLPQLVVVGSQSAGKSSVIENIVGRDFLPRGNNIVTRRPLVLHLRQLDSASAEFPPLPREEKYEAGGEASTADAAPSKKQSSKSKQQSKSDLSEADDTFAVKEWGEFLHIKGKRFYDFTEIRAEIQRDTVRVTNSNTAISPLPITLTIFSPHVLDLTLVDLPGITQNPVGDQPRDIQNQIREMILPFIQNPNSIIVAVTPATVDLANSDALKLAKEVDPQGLRTLGVITKLDLMDRGTHCYDVLNNKVYPLREYGYVGLVNRTQQDINTNKPISEAIRTEKAFFESHPVYRSMASRLGTPYLATKLNSILVQHIKKCVPEIRNRIAQSIIEAHAQLEGFGASQDGTESEKGSALLQIIIKFCKNFNDAIEGKLPDPDAANVSGGSTISDIFHTLYSNTLAAIDPFDDLTDQQIRTAILNATATRPSLFVTEVSFELLVKRQIRRLLQPSVQCSELVYDELRRVASQCLSRVPELGRFPALAEKLEESARFLLQRHLQNTKNMISDLTNIQLAYIKTTHPEFMSSSEAIARHLTQQPPPQDPVVHSSRHIGENSIQLRPVPTNLVADDITHGDRGVNETQIIKSLIQSYFNIVRKNIQDAVPKAIMCFLVQHCKDDMQTDLLKQLYRPELFDTLMVEDKAMALQRAECVEYLKRLTAAQTIINRIKDYDVFPEAFHAPTYADHASQPARRPSQISALS